MVEPGTAVSVSWLDLAVFLTFSALHAFLTIIEL